MGCQYHSGIDVPFAVAVDNAAAVAQALLKSDLGDPQALGNFVNAELLFLVEGLGHSAKRLQVLTWLIPARFAMTRHP